MEPDYNMDESHKQLYIMPSLHDREVAIAAEDVCRELDLEWHEYLDELDERGPAILDDFRAALARMEAQP